MNTDSTCIRSRSLVLRQVVLLIAVLGEQVGDGGRHGGIDCAGPSYLGALVAPEVQLHREREACNLTQLHKQQRSLAQPLPE